MPEPMPEGQQAEAAQCRQAPSGSGALVLVVGRSFVVRCCGGEGAVAEAAGAVRRAVSSLHVGRHVLEVPVAASITAGPSVHFLQQRKV